jgi:hypothetical protein
MNMKTSEQRKYLNKNLVLCTVCAPLVTLVTLVTLAAMTAQAQERRRWEDPTNLVALNTSSDDFAPAWSPEERLLYFSSTENGYAQFHTALYEPPTRTSDFKFSTRTLLPVLPQSGVQSSLNTPRSNTSFITFAPSGTAYFSAFRQTKRRPYLNIFEALRGASTSRNASGNPNGSTTSRVQPSSIKNNQSATELAETAGSKQWQRPEPVPTLNTDGFNAHPSIAPSGKFIVFSSDRSGGRGGTDLWLAVRDETGEWQPPVNMGDVLNSRGDEVSPFLASSDSLYFASNGFGGKGGFEIFLSVRTGSRWQAPVPVVELNSEYDDYDFTLLPVAGASSGTSSANTASGASGAGGTGSANTASGARVCVFASNRAGGRGGTDLYASRLTTLALTVASVEYKVQTQTTFLAVEEFATTDVLPMLPALFFGDNSTALPAALRQRSREEAAQYSPSAARPDPLGVYAETLNIIGRRMQDYPEAALVLTPFVPESASPRQIELARSRVQTIQQYMKQIWGIEPERLISATPRSVAEMLPNLSANTSASAGSNTGSNTGSASTNTSKRGGALKTTMLGSNERSRCVELACNDARLLAPVRIGGLNTLSKIRKLETYIDARPRDLVRSWSFFATAGADTLLATEGAALPYTVNIPLAPETLNRISDEIRLRLVGVDSLKRTSASEVPVTVYKIPMSEKVKNRNADKVVERHRILLLDESQNDLSADQRETLRSIVAALTPSASVVVSGYGSSDARRSGAQVEQFVSFIADELRRLVQERTGIAPSVLTNSGFASGAAGGSASGSQGSPTVTTPQQQALQPASSLGAQSAQGAQNVTIMPEFLGESEALLSASPQERLYARSVMITIERLRSSQERSQEQRGK